MARRLDCLARSALGWEALAMTDVVAIDPGAHHCARAVFRLSRLVAVSFIPSGEYAALRIEPDPDICVREKPQLDGRPAIHCIALADAGAFLAGQYPAVKHYAVEPREWKGSVPKPAHHTHIWEVLNEAERRCFPLDTAERISVAVTKGAKDGWRKDGARYYGRGKGSDVHNLLDATGLGLWALGRLKGPLPCPGTRRK